MARDGGSSLYDVQVMLERREITSTRAWRQSYMAAREYLNDRGGRGNLESPDGGYAYARDAR